MTGQVLVFDKIIKGIEFIILKNARRIFVELRIDEGFKENKNGQSDKKPICPFL